MNTSKFESLTGSTDLRFPEYDDPPADPVALVRAWLDRAVELGVREPRALALATADGRGRPSTRIVAFVTLDDDGLLFTTHSTSRKSREIAETGWASGLLYWRETGQQISLNGPVTAVPDDRADALWAGRPVPLHAMSAASRQSEPLTDPRALLAHAEELGASGTPLPRPERYVGYRLRPEEVEFWSARSDRLHHRLGYRRDRGTWSVTRLQP
ncbi:phenazine biosynthesis FMN-dependent oxidase PhzG [Streptomyces sp. NBC_01218]|uniref:phenazine biosynthesis FMN-dependent oxidase PhzG n=1 Tax=unclassified Streptomyces TaxID=2593676 RepID=UPI0023B8D944|nr:MULTISPECIES: phenazine biosynthesis FMN-dependent oxidase PhzG [unclassified Streptomyces]WEH39146.1 phenazine biosynthesis FMN-dependent oxidase PhzG [Streptomyces sp. AM 2-1-1]WSQ50803.1 phenazine biosynthesis FMN-dependent oxidase PhzG [Streptomyces sp. NBC_01218]